MPKPTETDVIVIGSGAAGLATACAARAMGLDVVVIEKASHFGGTTGLSGAAIWIPLGKAARAAGSGDTCADVLEYLHATIGENADAALLESFVDNAGDALAFLEQHTHLDYRLRKVAPDYHCENPGASEFGRVLDVVEFDGRRLGDNFANLRAPLPTHLVFGGMMVNRADVRSLLHFGRTRADTWRSIGLTGRYALDRVRGTRGTRLVVGSALTAQLALSVFEAGIPLLLNASARELLKDNDRVTGIGYETRDGVTHTLTARRAVVLATGGFAAHEGKSRSERGQTDADHFSMASDSARGEGQDIAQAAGAVMAPRGKSAFFLAPVSIRQTRQGEKVQFAHLTLDRAKPGVIAVNRTGTRFTNEADSYHRFGAALRTLPDPGKGKPVAWLVCDASALRRYGLGLARPFPAHLGNRKLIRDKYLIEENSISDLAERLSMRPETLAATIDRHNEFARSGTDGDFAKGGSAHNVSLGDPTCGPNPCLAPLAQAPFYAIGLYSGDLGTARGLKTDAKARALKDDGNPIPGLYAVGNDMHSIMGGTYPAAGITLGPALTFAYVAARDIAGKNETREEPT
ncbi:MAG: FAD-dependent oxidoreductase [Sedimentitalea sp.]|uniref:FAD-dependent oxidoreductase n=1 Tax=Sedimentitalea sp. TaxID=2048915 RepID=UPI00326385B2